MTQNDLQLIPTNDLLDELLDRFEHIIICGLQTKVESNNDTLFTKQYKGDFTFCRGLCNEMDSYLEREVAKLREDR